MHGQDDKYSHAIPVVPEFPSDTDYNLQFYEDRRAENNRLAGLTIQYVDEDVPPAPTETIGTATIFGDSSVLDGTSHTYEVTLSGTVDIDDCTVVYTTDKGEDVVADDTITFNGDGITNHTITATITHPTAGDSPVTATYVVEVKGAPGFDNFELYHQLGSFVNYGSTFAPSHKGLDPDYTSSDYAYFYTIIGDNTAKNSVTVTNLENNYPYWRYDGTGTVTDTPCIVTETFTLKSDPSVTATFNLTFVLKKT